VTAAKLKRPLARRGLRLRALPRPGLDRHRRQHPTQFAQVRTARRLAKACFDGVAKPAQQIQSDQIAIAWRNRRTNAIRSMVVSRLRGHDGVAIVNRDAQLHLMHRLPRTVYAEAGLEVVRFDVEQLGLQIPQSIVAHKRLHANRTRMHRFARSIRG